jgi:uncharacterized membrane protein YccC
MPDDAKERRRKKMIALVLGVVGLAAGLGAVKLGLFDNQVVKMLGLIATLAILLGAWFVSVQIAAPGFVDTFINFVLGLDWLIAPISGFGVGMAIRGFLR